MFVSSLVYELTALSTVPHSRGWPHEELISQPGHSLIAKDGWVA